MRSILRPQTKRTVSLVPNYVILTLLVIFSLAPLTNLVFNSFKSIGEVGHNPLGPPQEILLENYPKAWERGNFSVTVRNSAIIVFGTVIGICIIAGLAAYALARLNLPGADALTMYFLVGTSMPVQLFLVPLFFLWNKLGLIDNILGIIPIYWAIWSPFATFLLRSYMVSIPRDFEDAARVDGASEWQVFAKVMIPLCWPGFLTTGLCVGLWAWNEFLLAVTFLHRPEVRPITTSYWAFVSLYQTDWGLTSAAAVMMILPPVILFLSLQRHFIEGLTRGGLKA